MKPVGLFISIPVTKLNWSKSLKHNKKTSDLFVSGVMENNIPNIYTCIVSAGI